MRPLGKGDPFNPAAATVVWTAEGPEGLFAVADGERLVFASSPLLTKFWAPDAYQLNVEHHWQKLPVASGFVEMKVGAEIRLVPILDPKEIEAAKALERASASAERSTTAWLSAARTDLAPREVNADGTVWHRVEPADRDWPDYGQGTVFMNGFLQEYRTLLGGEMRGYSVEEVRRWLLKQQKRERPGLELPLYDKEIVRRTFEPFLERDRLKRLEQGKTNPALVHPIDRLEGPDPHFAVAVHFADHLLSQEIGMSFEAAVQTFIRKHPWLELSFAGGFDLEHARRLSEIYDLIPRWPNGRMEEDTISYANPWPAGIRGHQAAMDQALDYLQEVQQAANISPWSKLLFEAAQFRGLGPILQDCVLMNTGHGFGNKLSAFMALAQIYGLPGGAMESIQKPGTAGETTGGVQRVADLQRRILGMRVIALDAEDASNNRALSELASTSVARQAEKMRASGDARSIILEHIGLKTMDAMLEVEAKLPGIIGGVLSHTTSDGLQFRDQRGELIADFPFPIETVSLSKPKIEDEAARMPANITKSLINFVEESGDSFGHRAQLVLGNGRIMGPAVLEALMRLTLRKGPITLYDLDETARDRGRQMAASYRREMDDGDRFEVVDRLDDFTKQNPRTSEIAIHCCGNGPDTLTYDGLLSLFEKIEEECSAVIFNYQSGTDGPPGEQIKEHATRRELVYGKYGKVDTGPLPAVAYTIPRPGKGDLTVIAHNNFWVSNFGSMKPEVVNEAADTINFMIADGLAMTQLRRQAGQTGAHAYDSLQIFRTKSDQRILLFTEPGARQPETTAELLEQQPGLADAVRAAPHQQFFLWGAGNHRGAALRSAIRASDPSGAIAAARERTRARAAALG